MTGSFPGDNICICYTHSPKSVLSFRNSKSQHLAAGSKFRFPKILARQETNQAGPQYTSLPSTVYIIYISIPSIVHWSASRTKPDSDSIARAPISHHGQLLRYFKWKICCPFIFYLNLYWTDTRISNAIFPKFKLKFL